MKYENIPSTCVIKNNKVYSDYGRRIAVAYGRNCNWYHDNTGQIECLTHPAIINVALGRYNAVQRNETEQVLKEFDQELYTVAKKEFGPQFKVQVGDILSISWPIGLHFIISRHPNTHLCSEMCLFGINSHIISLENDKLSVYNLPMYEKKSLEEYCNEPSISKKNGRS